MAWVPWNGKATRAAGYMMKGQPTQYTLELRKRGHEAIEACARAEQERGNPWVRFGISIARRFEQARGNTPVDGWVPAESAYWNHER